MYSYSIKLKLNVLFIVLAMLVDCDSSQNKEIDLVLPEYYQIRIHDLEVSKQFNDILKNEDISFEQIDPETIKVNISNQKKIDELYFEYIESDLPKDRSISLSMTGLEEEVIGEFKSHNINFIKKKRYGKSWLVWSSDDAEEANEIIRESEERLMDEYMESINNSQESVINGH
ncbi:hypothetical protein [Kangiella sp. M94]